jgi:hypothetical protein
VRITTRTLSVGALTGLLAVGVAGTAMADPAAPSDTALVAVGSDTTQEVMNGLAAAIPALANYNATGGGTISTRTSTHTPCQTMQRPNGSTAGKAALQSAVGNQIASGGGWSTTGAIRDGSLLCVDVARSSSASFPAAPSGATSAAYRRYEFATDAVSYATFQNGTVQKKLAIFDLKRYYTANGTPGTAACFNKKPLIPQTGSGTRSFWATVMGVTDTLLSDPTVGSSGHWGTCVRDTTDGVIGSSAVLEEHNASTIDNKGIVPFSVAQWIAQSGNTITDVRGFATLGAIDWTAATGSTTTNAVSPLLMQTSFGSGTRTVYNFVSKEAAVSGYSSGTANPVPFNPAVAATFEGATSAVCTNTAIIQKYGFGVDPNCGQFVDGP